MSDMHSFSVDVAKEVGVNAAILLQSIKWWCEKNRANGKHCHDGLYWTYNSVKAWQKLYPYLGKSAIDNALKKLEERGFIKVGNHNKSAYDRTKWYAITDDGLRLFGDSISENRKMEEQESGSPNSENGNPIPDTDQLLEDVDTSIPFNEIISYLNDKTGKRFSPKSKQSRDFISGRWHDGYTLEDFKKVIDNMVQRWAGTEYEQYLQPSTLFRPSHFDEYLNKPKLSTSESKRKEGRLNEYNYR